MIKWGMRCTCVCGCTAKDDEEKVTSTGCVACADANHDMHVCRSVGEFAATNEGLEEQRN